MEVISVVLGDYTSRCTRIQERGEEEEIREGDEELRLQNDKRRESFQFS